MRSKVSSCAIVFFGLIGIVIAPAVARAADPDWKAVEQALGKSGQLQPGDVFRVGMPRTDLAVTVKGVPVKAGFALGSYAAFKQMGDRAMVMGDLVLLDQEVPAVMSGLFSGGLDVTAVHNHLNEMSPHVMYMHYEGHGDAVQLAKALRQALSASATPLGGPPATAATGGPALDPKQIEQALGRQGKDIGGGVFQITVPRAEAITEMGQPLLPAMGVVTVLNFQPTTDGKAAITGDFVLVDREVNAVAKALRQHGIDVTAIHNHGLMDTPRLFYMHFWANDDPAKLAQGLKAALEQTNSVKAK
ncbi:MAG: peptidase M23 [Candidatus Rokuibacteriota bacterium]|nr:MAG: peptidase M23 [Candidatus Rokubacteria bacterium]